MSLNLHAAVRGAINAVNPEFLGTWRESTGFTVASDGKPVPTYTDHALTPMRVQALAGRDLMHTNFLSMQGVKRVVTAFGNIQGVNRPGGLGGDLLLFPLVRGGANKTWLVVEVFESWAPDVDGWCRVGVVLQP